MVSRGSWDGGGPLGVGCWISPLGQQGLLWLQTEVVGLGNTAKARTGGQGVWQTSGQEKRAGSCQGSRGHVHRLNRLRACPLTMTQVLFSGQVRG